MGLALARRQMRQEAGERVDRPALAGRQAQDLAFEREMIAGLGLAIAGLLARHPLDLEVVKREFVVAHARLLDSNLAHASCLVHRAPIGLVLRRSGGEAVLELSGVTKRLGGTLAVDGVSFSVRRGSITGLIGPNGAGKTTLFNAIAGLFAPTRGSIRFAGDEIAGRAPYAIFRKGI